MSTLNRPERTFFSLALVIALSMALMSSASAMHIMEGMLPPTHAILWSVICIPVLALGLIGIRRLLADNPRTLVLLAMSGAFIFVISSLKIPSVTGSCSHMTGTGLAAILFGCTIPSVLGIIVLLFQAILLAHGGLTTLGANVFSMAILGPLVVVALYRLSQKLGVSKKLSIFIAATMGDLITYCVTSVQLAAAYPSETGGFVGSLLEFLTIFAITQIPLAIIEGLLTMLIVMALESVARPELRAIGFLKGGTSHDQK